MARDLVIGFGAVLMLCCGMLVGMFLYWRDEQRRRREAREIQRADYERRSELESRSWLAEQRAPGERPALRRVK